MLARRTSPRQRIREKRVFRLWCKESKRNRHSLYVCMQNQNTKANPRKASRQLPSPAPYNERSTQKAKHEVNAYIRPRWYIEGISRRRGTWCNKQERMLYKDECDRRLKITGWMGMVEGRARVMGTGVVGVGSADAITSETSVCGQGCGLSFCGCEIWSVCWIPDFAERNFLGSYLSSCWPPLASTEVTVWPEVIGRAGAFTKRRDS